MDIQKFMKKTEEEKISVNQRKRKIQAQFREKLSLVDIPKQGFGNTNDGNTARRAFENAEVFAEITDVDLEVIVRLRTVLKAVCSSYDLEPEKFQEYCYETTAKILSMYSWYTIPHTVHKLLEHGAQVAEMLELPLDCYSEEAQEAQNKEIWKARLNHSAKVSRVNVMKNQFCYLLSRSDPVILSMSFKKNKSENGKL
jgi:hypothetical protein